MAPPSMSYSHLALNTIFAGTPRHNITVSIRSAKTLNVFCSQLKVLKDKPGDKTSRQLRIDFADYTVHPSLLNKNAQDVGVLLDYLLPRELICFSPIGYQHLQFYCSYKIQG